MLNKFVPNQNVVSSVPFMKLMYWGCFPLSKLLNRLGLSPHQITSISDFVGLLAVLALAFIGNPFIFPTLWFLSLVFDVCDGLVARMTDRTTPNGGFHDRFSDQIKFICAFFAVSLRYESPHLWMATFIVTVIWLLNTVLNKEADFVRLKYETMIRSGQSLSAEDDNRMNLRDKGSNKFSLLLLKKNPMVWSVYSFFFILYGNANLLILPISFGYNIAFYTLIFFAALVFKSVVRSFLTIIRLNKEIYNLKLTVDKSY